jgi:hypothetical protein
MTRSTTGILKGSSDPGERNIRRKKQKLMAGVLQGLEALAISNRHISFYAIPNSRRPGVRGLKNTYVGGENCSWSAGHFRSAPSTFLYICGKITVEGVTVTLERD